MGSLEGSGAQAESLSTETESSHVMASSRSLLPSCKTLSRATSGAMSCASLVSLPAGRLSQIAAAKSEEVVELEARFDAAASSEEQLEAATLLVVAREELVALLMKEGILENCPSEECKQEK